MRFILDDIIKDNPVLNETESRLVDFAEELLGRIDDLHDQLEEGRKFPAVTRGGYTVATHDDGERVQFHRMVHTYRNVFDRERGEWVPKTTLTTSILNVQPQMFEIILDRIFRQFAGDTTITVEEEKEVAA